MVSLRCKLVSGLLIQASLLVGMSWQGSCQVEQTAALATRTGAITKARASQLQARIEVGRLLKNLPAEAAVAAALATFAATWPAGPAGAVAPPDDWPAFEALARELLPSRQTILDARATVDTGMAPLLAKLGALDQAIAALDLGEAAEVVAEARRQVARLQNSFFRYSATAGEADGEQALLALHLAKDELGKACRGLQHGDAEAEIEALADPAARERAGAAAAEVEQLGSAIGVYVAALRDQADRNERFQAAADRLDQQITAAQEAADRQGATAAAEALSAQRWVVGSCAAFLIAQLLLLLTKVVRPIRGMAALLAEIGRGECDLQQRLAITSRDEIGDFARGFNSFVAKIHSTMQSVDGSVSELNRSVAALDLLGNELRSEASTTQDGAQKLATAADRVVQAVEVAATTTRGLQDGNQAVQDCSGKAKIQAVAAATMVDQVHTSVHALAERSQEIGKVTDIISNLARQTNMLSLNAAIEAARAGAAGAGFAVVADEVRSLANRTAEQAAAIGKSIEAMQQDTIRSVRAMEELCTTVGDVRDMQNEIGAAVQRQHEASAAVGNEVAAAAAGSAQIRASCPQVTDGTARTRELTDGASTLTGTVRGIAGQLDQLVHQFRL